MKVWLLGLGVVLLVAIAALGGVKPALDPDTGIPNLNYVKNGVQKSYDIVTEAIKSKDDQRIKAAVTLILEVLNDHDFCKRYTTPTERNIDLWLKELIKQKRNEDVESLATAAIETFKTDEEFVAACQERRKMDPGKPVQIPVGNSNGEKPALDAEGVPNILYVANNIPKSMAILTEMVKSNDEARIHRAMSVLADIFANSNISKKDNSQGLERRVDEWLKELLKQKRYDDVEKLALSTMCRFPYNLKFLEAFQERRIRAKLDQGKADEALILSKSLYNVCAMSSTSHAIDLVCECIQAMNKDKDPEGAVKKFKLQQVLGAAPPSTTQPAADSKDQQTVFKSIKVDPASYQDAITTAESDFDGIDGLFAKGNLMLLADQPAQARVPLEKAYKTATEKDLAAGAEGVARAMRAEDGCVGRANAWVLSLRPKDQ